MRIFYIFKPVCVFTLRLLPGKSKLFLLDGITRKPGSGEIQMPQAVGDGEELLPGNRNHHILGALVCERCAGQAKCGQVGTAHHQWTDQLQIKDDNAILSVSLKVLQLAAQKGYC